jgi:CrcB protein
VIILLILLAGGAGSLLRFVGDELLRTHLGRNFPWGTMIINISGSLLLGVVTGLALRHYISGTTKLILGTGFCGGYTTFSTASFETVRLIEDDRYWSAVINAFGSTGSVVLAAAIGLAIIS